MKTKKLNWTLALTIVIGFGMISCERSTDEINTDYESDDAEVEALMSDLDGDADEVAYYKTSSTDTLTEGLEITDASSCEVQITESNNDDGHRIITIDWGSENCLSHSGRYKRGKVIVTLTDSFRVEGAQRIVTFEDFYINDNRIEGSRTVTNDGDNAEGHPVHRLVAEITITTVDGSTITRNRNGAREWTEGYDTWAWGDNVWEVTGTCSGVRADGNAYTRTVISPLVVSAACRFITSGVVDVSSDERGTATIDFGDGTCDSVAVVTKDGEEQEIDLSKKRRRWRK